MSNPPDLEPPSETLAALLRADRAAASLPKGDLAAKQAQVLARLAATLGPLDGPAPPPAAPPSLPPTPPPSLAATPPPIAPVGTGASFLASMFTKGGLTMLALGTLVGGATTVAFTSGAPSREPAAQTAPLAAASSTPLPASSALLPSAPPLPVPTTDAPPVPATPDPAASVRRSGAGLFARGDDDRDPELERERALLDVARGALARGNGGLALRSLDEHQARFPKGRLIEDREALRVKALLAAGRTGEAERTRAAFESKYPDSFALPRGTSAAGGKGQAKEPNTKENRDALTDPFSRRQ